MYPINLECDVELRILRLDDDAKILVKGIYDEAKGGDFVFQLSNTVCLGVNNIDQFKRDLERTEDETKCSIGSCLYYGEKVEDLPSSAVWAHANTRVGVSPTDNQNMECLVCEETVPTNNAVISEEHGQRLGFQIHEECKDELIDILETAWENNHEEILAEQTR